MAITFVEPKVSTLTVNVGTNAAGNIAQDGETATGEKTLSINGFKAGGNGTNATAVLNALLTKIAGANYDESSVQRKTVSGVEVQ